MINPANPLCLACTNTNILPTSNDERRHLDSSSRFRSFPVIDHHTMPRNVHPGSPLFVLSSSKPVLVMADVPLGHPPRVASTRRTPKHRTVALTSVMWQLELHQILVQRSSPLLTHWGSTLRTRFLDVGKSTGSYFSLACMPFILRH